ncbi:MAG: hypothetical protein EZS28_000509 [Streblomastix strix]|uniref:Uncharacterized protein n=1 Tax=Streblomastix strix TaxID=222440 RepID=A0A5J4XA12_9EUKA|nr:MAG: hypothetical protein EZS28_000509 [Streblomastix strix]
MSSEPHQFIKYIGGQMYMCGSQTGKIEGETEEDCQLLIAEVKGHIDENYISTYGASIVAVNDFINFHLFQGIMYSQLMNKLSDLISSIT